jgi:formamidopyrimidine-DNA glycosylase
MPELPEVEAALELLRDGANGRTITRVTLLHPALQRRFTPSQLSAMSGARIVRVERRGKHQLLHFDDGRVLHAHFRMNGDWALVRTSEELPRFARAVLEFEDGGSLVFLDSRMLGTIDLHPAGATLDFGLGPDAADPGWTAEQLAAALASRRGPIKPALLDQALVAGLGNIYAAESLWRARISPFAACSSLTLAQVTALRSAIAEVIARATGSRYTDDDTVKLDVYDREGLPCRRCRTPIQRVTQAARSTYFCPHCQPAVIVERVTQRKKKAGTTTAKTSSKRATRAVGTTSGNATTTKSARKAVKVAKRATKPAKAKKATKAKKAKRPAKSAKRSR